MHPCLELLAERRKGLSICCSDVVFVSITKKVDETFRKVIKATIQERLPSMMKTALEQTNLGEL